ncbi:MAG TPA: PhzF family phenazine biosynthesis protein [Chloroflexaceae bacterium]|nr:PhzF family phenazine biosynthesis protein [Chloroflexaceae bacterium]
MPAFPYRLVDAFTDRPLGGNPCAVIFDADPLDAATMQALAREMNLSETAFVRRSGVADVGARYFTPAEEIPLAGHPTIATIFALVDAGRIRLDGEETRVTLELPAGVVEVAIHARHGMVGPIVMSQLAPRFLAVYDPAEVLPAFGLAPEDTLPGAPVQTVSTGTPQLMIALRDHAALRRARVDPAAYAALRARGDFFSPHLFCLGGATPAGRTFARHFGLPPDSPEDPFTGSATGGMAAYLWRHGLIDTPTWVAEQGHWMGRPGQGTVEVVGPPDAISTVRVGGGAAVVVRGELTLGEAA